MSRLAAALALLTIASCTTRPAATDSVEREIITYETTACFGTCPAYRLTVDSFERSVLFDGRRFTAVAGERRVPATDVQAASFVAALDEARRADQKDFAPGGKRCASFATDHPGVIVTFRKPGGKARRFDFNYGCRDPQNATLAADLKRAPTLLPIADLIGRR